MATTAPAPRLRAPSWRDPRLVVGVVLVCASVLLGAWVVDSAQRTTPVWAASATLTPGDPVASSALSVVQVHLGAQQHDYLAADRPLPAGRVVLRTVDRGELLPRTAIGSAHRLQQRPVGLAVSAPLSSGVSKGARVDVWVSMPLSGSGGASGYAAPRQLAAGAVVSQVSAPSSVLGTGGTTTVQVLLSGDALRRALAAEAAQAQVAVVLVPGSSPGRG